MCTTWNRTGDVLVCSRLEANTGLCDFWQCSFKWWVQSVGFALQVSDLPWSSLHRETLADNVQYALAEPSSANWAAQIVRHVRSLGLPALLAPDGTVLIDKSSFRRHAADKSHEVWQGLHASPRSAPTKGAKLCTYYRWLRASVLCQSRTFSCP